MINRLRVRYITAASRIAELFEGAEGEPIFIENYKADDNADRTGAYHLFNTISIEGYGEFDVNINVLGYKDKNADNTLYQLELTIENPAHQEAAPGMPNATTPYTRSGVSGSRLAAYRSFVENDMTEIKKKTLADGTFMKAPNGADTKLTEWQWKMVRTRAFKAWFGDWEKVATFNAIEKLEKMKPVSSITGQEFAQTGKNDLVQRVVDYWAQHGNVAHSPMLGEVNWIKPLRVRLLHTV